MPLLSRNLEQMAVRRVPKVQPHAVISYCACRHVSTTAIKCSSTAAIQPVNVQCNTLIHFCRHMQDVPLLQGRAGGAAGGPGNAGLPRVLAPRTGGLFGVLLKGVHCASGHKSVWPAKVAWLPWAAPCTCTLHRWVVWVVAKMCFTVCGRPKRPGYHGLPGLLASGTARLLLLLVVVLTWLDFWQGVGNGPEHACCP